MALVVNKNPKHPLLDWCMLHDGENCTCKALYVVLGCMDLEIEEELERMEQSGEQATYKINSNPISNCVSCNHHSSAHGSNGIKCCVFECKCERFVQEFDNKKPLRTDIKDA